MDLNSISQSTHVSPGFVPLISNRQTVPRFVPKKPETFSEAGVRDIDVEALILKALFAQGAASGRQIAEQLKFSTRLLRSCLEHLREEQLVVHRGTADLVDYTYQLTDQGFRRAKHVCLNNTYCGAVPVSVDAYAAAIKAQLHLNVNCRPDDLQDHLAEMEMEAELVHRIALAMNSQRAIMLYGAPGNGKSTIAQKIGRALRNPIWIPRTLAVGGDIIRLFDSAIHKELDPVRHGFADHSPELDRRWALIEPPVITVGGELLLEQFEIRDSGGTRVLEAPLHMKSNLGTFIVDDFGRQRISATDILNRLIVPLERRVDYLILPNGRQIQIPVEHHLVLATNLVPANLLEEAFLRRVPYKIEMPRPDLSMFQKAFENTARRAGMEIEVGAFEYLIRAYYRNFGIGFAFSHAPELIAQMKNFCDLYDLPLRISERAIDTAARNYFGG
jgi:predicted ATPase with chaperone activity